MRFTNDLIGNGYEGRRRRIRDTETSIHIDFFISGEYPGDGKLKLASGLSSEWRYLYDLGDVQKLISEMRLPRELADQLDPSVRPEYLRMWEAWKNRPTTAPDYEPDEP
ncbi:MAG TPA: hypothetical protein VJ276_22265 [Thermoanaerobaculia bacterium]|nr:hypothetical protein [Thermoanaerobaculia bacterium]